MHNINTIEYWDMIFETRVRPNNWEKRKGLLQSKDFMRCILNTIPTHLKKCLKNNASIIDIGCGIASGTSHLKKSYPMCNVIGYDFSDNALKINIKEYSIIKCYKSNDYLNINFINELSGRYDVGISSNVLEHVTNPIKYLENNVINMIDKYLIILIPYKENLETSLNRDHLNSFDLNSFPDKFKCDDGKDLKVFMIKTLLTRHWFGKQMIVIYKKGS